MLPFFQITQFFVALILTPQIFFSKKKATFFLHSFPQTHTTIKKKKLKGVDKIRANHAGFRNLVTGVKSSYYDETLGDNFVFTRWVNLYQWGDGCEVIYLFIFFFALFFLYLWHLVCLYIILIVQKK